MFEVSPLSPVRAWASVRSCISALQVLDGGLDQPLGQQRRGDCHHLSRGLHGPAAAGRSIEVERFNLVAEPDGGSQAVGPAGYTDADLHGLWASFGESRSENGVD